MNSHESTGEERAGGFGGRVGCAELGDGQPPGVGTQIPKEGRGGGIIYILVLDVYLLGELLEKDVPFNEQP